MPDTSVSPRRGSALPWLIAVLLAIAAGWLLWDREAPRPPSVTIPSFKIPIGTVRAPLPYRIVSFHRGRADKNLIKLASQLGFNGVQFQIEGSNEQGLMDFAARDAQEHLIDYCHSLGMKVTVWVHELSDLPGAWMPEYLGEVGLNNEKLWATLDQRYEWILSKAIPNVDGLVLTVVETQVRATSTPMMQRVVELVDRKCKEHGKSLIVRTFVWHPDELSQVMAAVDTLPKDMVIMSKAVPQDWQMRGTDAAEIGAVGGRPQIEEYDVMGEYFLRDNVANCMVELLKKQFDHGISKNIQGICVRVDREDSNVLFQPQEVNLWALGLLSAGASNDVEDIWKRWATYRYGDKAARGIITTLKPTASVIAEMLSIGPFTHGDTRAFPAMPDDNVFDTNWQNWRWDASFVPTYNKALVGDAEFTAEVEKGKDAAQHTAEQCLADLEKVKADLPPAEYAFLYTKLLTNKVQLEFRTPMALAVLHFRQMRAGKTEAQVNAAWDLYKKDMARVREVAGALSVNKTSQVVKLWGRMWRVNVPLGVTREQLYKWAYDAERMLNYYW